MDTSKFGDIIFGGIQATLTTVAKIGREFPSHDHEKSFKIGFLKREIIFLNLRLAYLVLNRTQFNLTRTSKATFSNFFTWGAPHGVPSVIQSM